MTDLLGALVATFLLLTGISLIGYAARRLFARIGVTETCGERYALGSVITCTRPRGHDGLHADHSIEMSWPQ